MTKGLAFRQLAAAQANGLFALLVESANRHALPLAYVLAICSRETNIRNIAGDGGHGRSVMQIDDRYHAIAREEDFRKDPELFIDYGCKMLADNRKWAQKWWPQYTAQQCLKIAASAYNCGRVGARSGTNKGNSDLKTTGQDYGKDVIARMIIFQELLDTEELRKATCAALDAITV